MFEEEGKLTVRLRILLHLEDLAPKEKQRPVPFEVTQEGIANAVRIKERHVSQYIRPLIAEGLVVERSSYAQGGRQRRKVYFLTAQGRTEATKMKEVVRHTRNQTAICTLQ